MTTIDDILKNQAARAKKFGIVPKKIKREGPVRPWDVGPDDFKPSQPAESSAQPYENQKNRKYFDLDSTIKVGVTDIVGKPRGPRSRKEKLAERVTRGAGSNSNSLIAQPKDSSEPVANVAGQVTESGRPHSYSNPNVAGHIHTNVAGQVKRKYGPDTSKKIHILAAYLKRLSENSNQAGPTNYFQISNDTGIPERSLRRYLSQLKRKNIIAKMLPYRDPSGSKGTIFIINQPELNHLLSLDFLAGQIHPNVAGQVRRSSSNILNTTTYNESGRPLFIEQIDLSKIPNLDRQKLNKYLEKYPDLESLQDFVDRVAFAIHSQHGTKNEIKYPGAFMDKCFKTGVDVPATYKSRKALAEEEALKREQAELEEIQKIKEQRRQIALERTRLKFEEWLENQSREKLAAFEKSRSTEYPENREFPTPAAIQKIRLTKIQLREYLAEVGESETYLEPIIKTYEADEIKQWR